MSLTTETPKWLARSGRPRPPTRAKRPRAPITRTDLHWLELGQGRPIVLLHGLGDSHRTWLPIASLLARSRRVLMPDLHGHGFSARPDACYSLDWHARTVGDWLVARGLEDVDVVGHSFGGGVAQWLLLEHSRRVRRLALVAAGGLGRELFFPLRLVGAFPAIVERLGQPFMSHGTHVALRLAGSAYSHDEISRLSSMNGRPGSARAFARTVRDVIDWRGQRRAFFDRAHDIPRLPPMALFWGERDFVIPIRHATETAAALGGVTVYRFAASGHYPHRQEPTAFAACLEAFLESPTAERARMSFEGRARLSNAPRASTVRPRVTGS